MRTTTTLLTAGILMSGCAQTPPATVSYPLTHTNAHVLVTRVVKCDAQNHPSVTSSATVEVAHHADPSAWGSLDLSRLDGALANTSLDLHFAADQRLTSVNSESEGQGEAILKSAIGLATSAIGASEKAAGPGAAPGPAAVLVAQACAQLRQRVNDDALSVSYVIDLKFNQTSDFLPLNPRAGDEEPATSFALLLGTLCARYKQESTPAIPIAANAANSGLALLDARQPAPTALTIEVIPGNMTCNATPSPSIWSGTVAVVLVDRAHGQHHMRVRLRLPIGADIPMDIEIGNHPAVDELAPHEVARQLDTLRRIQLARERELDLARQLRVDPLLGRIDRIPEGFAVGQLGRRALRQ